MKLTLNWTSPRVISLPFRYRCPITLNSKFVCSFWSTNSNFLSPPKNLTPSGSSKSRAALFGNTTYELESVKEKADEPECLNSANTKLFILSPTNIIKGGMNGGLIKGTPSNDMLMSSTALLARTCTVYVPLLRFMSDVLMRNLRSLTSLY